MRSGQGRLRRRGVIAAGVVVPLLTGILTGCDASGGVVVGPLETSVSATFSNLWVLTQVEQGNPRPAPAGLATRTACQKGTPATPQAGAGNDWVCDITFLVAGPSTPVTAIYTLDVQTDGCYAADGDGPASVNGAQTITGPGYRALVNPLKVFDGCLDVT